MSSIKTMTTDQLNDDLEALVRMFPDGIPPQQEDRVKAIKGELKRRGDTAEARSASREQRRAPVTDLTTEALENELRRLSERIGKNGGDKEAQDRFADVRYELKKRSDGGVKTDPATADRVRGIAEEFVQDGQPTNGTTMAAVQAANAEFMQQMRDDQARVTLAQIAAASATRLLEQAHADGEVDGDAIKEACDVGHAVAKAIFERVGLKVPPA